MSRSEKMPTLRSKLVRRTTLLALVGLIATVLFLLYEHEEHDVEIIRAEMAERAKLVRTGLLATMMASGDQEIIRNSVNAYIESLEVQFSIFESEYVRNQFGGHPDEVATDPTVLDVLEGRRDQFDELSGSIFRFITPIVSDERCQRCHNDLNGDPIPVGTRLGVMEFNFDITDRRAKSLLMTRELIAGIIVFIIILTYSIYGMFNENVLKPIRHLTDDFAKLEREEFNITMPPPTTEEIKILVGQVRKTATALEEKKNQRESELEDERNKMNQIRSFTLKQADSLGITDENEIDGIVKRLSEAVREVEKTEMLSKVSRCVTMERKGLVLSNDISLIRPAAFYLTSLISSLDSSVQMGSVEVALEESITNAIIHGNLEVSSRLKERSFEEFDEEIKRRTKAPPYQDRKVNVAYDYSDGRAVFQISDEGPGFKWEKYMTDGESEDLLPHGRGIIIMRTFATSIKFSIKGNDVTLVFDINNHPPILTAS